MTLMKHELTNQVNSMEKTDGISLQWGALDIDSTYLWYKSGDAQFWARQDRPTFLGKSGSLKAGDLSMLCEYPHAHYVGVII